MELLNVVLPIVTLVIGYAGTLVTEAAQGQRARRIAKEERSDALSALHIAERRAFELETLQSLKGALAELARATGKAHHFDYMKARENDVDLMPSTQLPEDLNLELLQTTSRAQSLAGLVMDGASRVKVSEFLSATAQMAVAQRSVSEAETELLSASRLVNESQQLLSARIRAIYSGAPAAS